MWPPLILNLSSRVQNGGMRSIWKGSLVFGLVNVPVAVYSATEDNDIKFHQVHGADGGRIRYQRTCEICGLVVQFGDIVKGYESPDGRSTTLTDEDFKSLPVASKDREISLLSFVPSEQIDPVLFESSYYLEPATKSPKAYVLLRETLAETDRVAIVNFALRQKIRLAALRVKDDVLVLQTLRWPDEVRAAEFPSLSAPIAISPAEKKMAALLVDSYSDDFKPEEHEDTYRVELRELLEAKLEDKPAFADRPTEEGEDAEVLDLLAALQRSVQRHKGTAATESADRSTDEPAAEVVAPRRRTRKADSEKADSAPRRARTVTAEGLADAAEEDSPAANAPTAKPRKAPARRTKSA